MLPVRGMLPADLDAGEIAIRCERLVELYRGPFLATQPAPLWIVITRDRLQAKFVRVIKAAGAFWQANGRWDRATMRDCFVAKGAPRKDTSLVATRGSRLQGFNFSRTDSNPHPA